MRFPIQITASTLISSMGSGIQAHADALKAKQTGLKKSASSLPTKLDVFYGEVQGLPDITLPAKLAPYLCRNHQLAWQALQTDGFSEQVHRLSKHYGAHRIGIALGTSTSGILETEKVLAEKENSGIFSNSYHYETTHRMNALADFCAEALNVTGPRMIISTACSSSAKVFASASRWIDHGLVDAVIVGGVDTLCLTTIHGFNALGLISQEIVKPLDQARDGINIGEAGGFMLLERARPHQNNIQLTGFGETSDAYHISTPHPTGEGAQKAMQQALTMAGLTADDIDYLNLHGTGTPSNDLAESQAVGTVFANQMPLLSSTKGFTGHTLGAAGITEAVFCQIALQEQMALPNLNLKTLDENLSLHPVQEPQPANIQHCMSNSFGFGGNNASLVFSIGNLS
ncbi:beta-ketoacyl-ACP synthase [Hydrogenovibrio sp. 3SP14C1]|uniref:beta-ketoacyl-ACP synthase n=1 Tax=Hydrogenovibrio sp. 3SP14C1 TaxID=3038774 RepID=UPI0024174D67|nr:beta-ketoacyl-ACP synthase [Hydrogenovibrio sp. 3SP14C1]MDG4811606.1 beta-ketoacyl-ACP synthase [Hydrogenovibrio sp. 3SP14C1]